MKTSWLSSLVITLGLLFGFGLVVYTLLGDLVNMGSETFPSFSQMEKGYNNLYNTMTFTRSTAINNAATKIIQNKDRYLSVQSKTGVPWYFIGAIHMRESNNDFKGILHNGEKILGTGRKTKLVPVNRGPFNTWEEAAIDAIKQHNLQKISSWSIARMGYEGEKYNGIGYYFHGVNSPYLWGGTNHQQSGKYVADGVWSPTTKDTQLGIMPVIYRIRELEKITSEGISVPDKYSDKERKKNIDDSSSVVVKESFWIKLLKTLFVKK